MSSILGREIDAVVRDTDKPVVFRWVCEIYVNKEVYTPLKVLNIDFDENPETNFAPTIVVRVALAAGDYYKAILPNDSIVELSLKRYTVNSSYDTIDYSVPFIEKRYKATVYNKQDLATAGNIPSEISKELLNITDIVIVQFQLLSKAIEKLRVMTVGGVYRKSTVKDLLQTVLTNCLGQIDVS
ncbi:MAG TPA: hypothetical protein VHJ59_01805, partial [Nitrososphaera sp.]|nr:hypothetical protein [Nitrososphaera sp.]